MTTKDTVADNRLKCVGLNFIEITSRRLSGHPHHTGSNSKLMETSMDRVYRIGAVGMGRMGMRHVRALAASDRWDLAYVCDLDEARLAAAHEALRAQLA